MSREQDDLSPGVPTQRPRAPKRNDWSPVSTIDDADPHRSVSVTEQVSKIIPTSEDSQSLNQDLTLIQSEVETISVGLTDLKEPAEQTLSISVGQSVSEPFEASDVAYVVRQPIAKEDLTEEQIGVPQQLPVKSLMVEDLGQDFPPPVVDVDEELNNSSDRRRWLVAPGLVAFLLAGVSIFTIVVINEVFQFIDLVERSPWPMKWLAWLCLGTLASGLVWSLVNLFLSLRQLKVSPKIVLPAEGESLPDKSRLKKDVQQLLATVKQYPIRERAQMALLQGCGLPVEKTDEFRDVVISLSNSDPIKDDPTGWIRDCESRFVSQLDQCARTCRNKYVKRVAVKAAMSPTGLFDGLIVAYNSMAMAEELCRLYNLRTGRAGSLFLLLRVVITTLVSARTEETIDLATKKLLADQMGEVSGFVSGLLGSLTGLVARRTGKVTVIGFLFYRLGNAMMAELRPIRSA